MLRVYISAEENGLGRFLMGRQMGMLDYSADHLPNADLLLKSHKSSGRDLHLNPLLRLTNVCQIVCILTTSVCFHPQLIEMLPDSVLLSFPVTELVVCPRWEPQ
jgi:hypothetical protein